jgi:hypothetical protein
MALMRVARVACAAIAPWPAPGAAQPLHSDVAVTAGASKEEVRAGSAQARVFGETRGLRFYVEGAWGTADGPRSDAFGAAYSYRTRPHLMEAYAEKMFRRDRFLASIRGGRFRTPFGIHTTSDHAYVGFLRAPLIRYPGNFALSNTFLEVGTNVMAGTPWFQAEATIGMPSDEGRQDRRRGLDSVVRVQGYAGALIAGLSHIRTQPYQSKHFAHGRALFTGFDFRWMKSGVQLRGEWLRGRPFDGTRTSGGYVDAFVHLRAMGPVTAVARLETLDYDARKFSRYEKRATMGARVRVAQGLAAHVNLIHHPGGVYTSKETVGDVAVTYTVRYPR